MPRCALCVTPHSLGYACIKEKEYGRALQAFTRSSQLEPENGEAWNNLAAIHMHMRHWKQAYNALSGGWRNSLAEEVGCRLEEG